MGNAGTAMRLFMGLLSAQPFDSELIGDESLMRRPMERAAKPLRAMGAQIETQDGKPPVRIRGGAPLHGIRYEMPVASAQVKSAVLLAGLYAQGETTVVEPAVTRDHTERMLQSFGCEVRARDGVVSLDGAARRCRRRRSACRATSRPPRSSWSPPASVRAGRSRSATSASIRPAPASSRCWR